VIITLVANQTAFDNQLFFEGPLGAPIPLFNWASTTGTAVNLGTFAEGTELVFKLLVKQTGDAFYSGVGTRNLDGQIHAVIRDVGEQVVVGFEDLHGGGDRDYDDVVFAFANAGVASASSPTSGPESDATEVGGGPTGVGGGSDTAAGSATGGEAEHDSEAGYTTPASGSGGAVPAAPAAATVDEPGTLLMLGTGLGALVLVMKRRQAVRR
jgi:hypothetical protein